MANGSVLFPDWPAPPHVRAVFTTRVGGVSKVPFDSLNLGDHVQDQPQDVAANRHLLALHTGIRPVFLKQVHGWALAQLDAQTPDGTVADSCLTARPGVACTIMVADCLPVLLTDTEGRAVAAAHAGWRGLAGQGQQGVLEAVFSAFQVSNRAFDQLKRVQAAPKIIAWLGPCIGPAAFEVGAEVKAAFTAGQPQAAQCFVETGQGKFLADLAGLARLRLQALGITQIYGNDSTTAWCTASNPSRFFSHRRDAGLGIGSNGLNTTGRMAGCIWLS